MTRARHFGLAVSLSVILVAVGSLRAGAKKKGQQHFVPSTASSSAFVAVGPMNTGREAHSGLVLPNGLVLIIGGSYDLAAELFDPVMNKFTALTAGAISTRRFGTATSLDDARILLTGGIDHGDSAELFDPVTLSSRAMTARLVHARFGHSAILLPSGKVLICGGEEFAGGVSRTAELFDPSSETFTTLSSNLSVPRYFHTLTRLLDGRVLIAGGFTGISGNYSTNSAEIFDPVTEMLTPIAATMNSARYGHTATLLPDGRVLLLGGSNGSVPVASAEMFNPQTNTFSPLANGMTSVREGHTASVLANGKILIAGGDVGPPAPVNTAEVFDPVFATFTSLAPDTMITARRLHPATVLPDGRVLLTAGAYVQGRPVNAAEVYTGPVPAAVQLQSIVSQIRHGVAATFDIDLPVSGTVGIECRANAVSGNVTLVFTFTDPLTSVKTAAVTNGTASITSSGIDPSDRHSFVVNLSGVANEQFITITLGNVADSQGRFSAAVSGTMGVLSGDTNGDGLVNVGDTVRIRSQAGNDLTNSNYRADVNADGLINVGDTVIARRQSGTGLPTQ